MTQAIESDAMFYRDVKEGRERVPSLALIVLLGQ
jgi:hypothetical protein